MHRDVSPQNVLISHDGDIKLCDFGIAKAASKASQTRAGALKGKLQYMSPEQAWGKNIDHRSDIFSLGLVLYEMLTSQKVFAGDSELSVLEQVRDPIIAAPSSHNPEIDPEIDRIVFKALHADREERYQSALDLHNDLEQVLRAHEWAPDRAAIAAFLIELVGGAPAPLPTAADVGAPPPPPPPPESGDGSADATPPPMPPEKEAVILPERDLELEHALSADSQPGFELETEPVATPLLDEFRRGREFIIPQRRSSRSSRMGASRRIGAGARRWRAGGGSSVAAAAERHPALRARAEPSCRPCRWQPKPRRRQPMRR